MSAVGTRTTGFCSGEQKSVSSTKSLLYYFLPQSSHVVEFTIIRPKFTHTHTYLHGDPYRQGGGDRLAMLGLSRDQLILRLPIVQQRGVASRGVGWGLRRWGLLQGRRRHPLKLHIHRCSGHSYTNQDISVIRTLLTGHKTAELKNLWNSQHFVERCYYFHAIGTKLKLSFERAQIGGSSL